MVPKRGQRLLTQLHSLLKIDEHWNYSHSYLLPSLNAVAEFVEVVVVEMRNWLPWNPEGIET